MLRFVRVFQIRVFVLFFAERFFFAHEIDKRPPVFLRCIVHVRFQKAIYPLIRIERHEMTVARARVQIEPVFIPHKPHEFICDFYRFDIHAIHIFSAVDFAERVLFIHRKIHFRYRVAAARGRIYALIERALNRTDHVIPRQLGFYREIQHFVLIQRAAAIYLLQSVG